MLRRRRKRESGSVSSELRRRALETKADELGLKPTANNPRVYGAVMEIAYPNGTATLVSFADGSTSLYFSSGGGMIGAGEHRHVAETSKAFVRAAADYVDAMEPTTSYPSPSPGQVRFQVLTFTGGFTAQAGEAELGEQRHPLSPLFYKGQDVITQLRRLEEQQTRG